MNIQGNKIQLTAVEESDLPQLLKWANDPEILKNLGNWHFPYSMKSIESWFSRLTVDQSNLRFAMRNLDGILIGTANLAEINWKDRNAFQGVMIGDPENRGKGYGADAVMALTKYGFEELGLNRQDTTIIEFNEASLHLYVEKCGWLIEGRQSNWYFRSNEYWDRIWLGITSDRFRTMFSNKV
jgi:RimJ/RimL family protein N-acetyltransferase